MQKPIAYICISLLAISAAVAAIAEDDPAHERHEMMEGVRDAAKPIGAMWEGEREYDQAVVMTSLDTFAKAAAEFGALFPAGSEGGEAAPAIWTDREGFDAALKQWADATAVAIEANPASLVDAEPVLGPVFGACKNCHDSYRIEEE